MSDGFVQVAPDSTGKRLETSELTTSAGVVVERERVTLGDPTNIANLVAVSNIGELTVADGTTIGLLAQVLQELRMLRLTLCQIGNIVPDGNTDFDSFN